MNRKRCSTNTSGFKGVSWVIATNKWIARIYKDYRCIHIGFFESKEEAARSYDNAARIHFGEFARLNFPNDGEQAA